MNHPAPDVYPNVMAWCVDIDAEAMLSEHGIKRGLLPYVTYPNWYYSSEWDEMMATPDNYPLGAVVMVSTRWIGTGAELLFDYGLGDENAERLEWYCKRNLDADIVDEGHVVVPDYK